jgi:putative phosphoesterase
MRIAAFSDIHSNLSALQAVLKEIDNDQIKIIVCGGDLVGYGPNPNEIIEEIRAKKIPTVLGNYDEGVGFDKDDCGCAYNTQKEQENGHLSLEWTKKNVTEENKAFLRILPRQIQWNIDGKQILFVHGSPRRINEYLFEDRPVDSIVKLLKHQKIDVIVFGHTHIPYFRVKDGVTFVNIGSVGKPKDGDPRACYCIIDVGNSIEVLVKRVIYPVEEVMAEIVQQGLPTEFAEALKLAGK